MAAINYPFKFDNNDIPALVTGLTVLAINSYLPPKRNLYIEQVARSDMNKATTGYYNQKDIAVTIGITRDTRANTENSLDSLFNYIQGIEKDLLIVESGSWRRYTATYHDFVLKRGGGSYIEFDLIFSCSDLFGYSLQYEQLLDATGRTLYNYTDSFTINGNALTQVPTVTAFISALTGAATNTIMIGNVATGRFISVSRAWTAGDRLVVDCKNKTVSINGANVDFMGAFPDFAPGIGYMQYQDNFATRTLALSVYYYRRFV